MNILQAAKFNCPSLIPLGKKNRKLFAEYCFSKQKITASAEKRRIEVHEDAAPRREGVGGKPARWGRPDRRPAPPGSSTVARTSPPRAAKFKSTAAAAPKIAGTRASHCQKVARAPAPPRPPSSNSPV